MDKFLQLRQFVPEEKINISVKYETPEGEQFGVVYPRQFLKTEKVELEDTMRAKRRAAHCRQIWEKEVRQASKAASDNSIFTKGFL